MSKWLPLEFNQNLKSDIWWRSQTPLKWQAPRWAFSCTLLWLCWAKRKEEQQSESGHVSCLLLLLHCQTGRKWWPSLKQAYLLIFSNERDLHLAAVFNLPLHCIHIEAAPKLRKKCGCFRLIFAHQWRFLFRFNPCCVVFVSAWLYMSTLRCSSGWKRKYCIFHQL